MRQLRDSYLHVYSDTLVVAEPTAESEAGDEDITLGDP